MTPLTHCNLSDKNVRLFPGTKFLTKRCKRHLLCALPAKDSELLGAQNRPPLLLRLFHLGLSTSRRRSHGQSSSPPRTALHRYNTALPSDDQGARRRPPLRKGADGTQRAETDGGLNSRGASCCCSYCRECVQCGGEHDCHSHHSFFSEDFSFFLLSAPRPVPSLPSPLPNSLHEIWTSTPSLLSSPACHLPCTFSLQSTQISLVIRCSTEEEQGSLLFYRRHLISSTKQCEHRFSEKLEQYPPIRKVTELPFHS